MSDRSLTFDTSSRFNIGASPSLKRQKEFSQPVFRMVDVLPALSRQLRLDEKAKEISVMSLVDHFLSSEFDGRFSGLAKASHMVFKNDKRALIIDVKSGLVASELGFYVPSLLQQINHYAPQTEITVHQIKLRIR